MPKGGARAFSGPAPDPDALRRDRPSDRNGWTELPRSGRQGPLPEWPLPVPMTAPEVDVWERIWRTPAAVAWESFGWQDDVAMYVRFLVLASAGDVKAASEARQWSDRLGLNPAAMLRNRWKIVDKPVAAVSTPPTAGKRTRRASSTSSTRSRLTVVDNAGGS